MKKVMPILIILALFLAACCGGGDSTEEPAETTPPTTMSPEPTTSPTETTPPTSTPEPTQEPSPTPTATGDPDAIENVLADVMPNLLVAFAEADGEWKSYDNPDVASLDTLWKGQGYYFYATEGVIVTDTWALGLGWTPMRAWTENTASVSEALGDFEEIIIIVGWDQTAQEWTLYQSPALGDLTEIKPGQTYYTFEAEEGDPISGTWNTETR